MLNAARLHPLVEIEKIVAPKIQFIEDDVLEEDKNEEQHELLSDDIDDMVENFRGSVGFDFYFRGAQNVIA